MLRDIHLFKSVQYHKTFSTACKIVPSCLLPHALLIVILLHNTFAVLAHPSSNVTDRAIELQQRSRWFIFSHRGPRIVRVPTVPDGNALFVALLAQIARQQAQSHSQGSSTALPAPGTNTITPDANPARSQVVRLLAHLVLFLCCASPQHAGGNTHPTQQQSQDQVQTHATSSQIQDQQGQSQAQPFVPSTPATPTVLNAHATAPGADGGQSRPLPLRTRFVLFLCCTPLPCADGHYH